MKRNMISLLLIFLFSGAGANGEDRQLVDRVAAVVNKEVITQSEFDMIFKPVYDQIISAYQGADIQRELETVRLKLLNQLIEDRLVYQEAEKLGITVSDSEIREEMGRFKAQFPDSPAFERQMAESGTVLSELERRLKERIAISKLHQSIIRGKVIVSPTEVEEYYQGHSEEFAQEEQVKVWGITVRKSEEAVKNGTTDEAGKRKIGGLIAQLKRGADFEALAKENSEDGLQAQNGLVGFVRRGDMADGIDQAIFALPDGGLTDILETEVGYHIFKVGERRQASKKTFEEAKDEIYEKLFRMKAHQRFLDWMDDLKKKSYISIR